MSTTTGPRIVSPRTVIIVSVLLAAIVGGLVGFGVNTLARPAPPVAQTRDFYLFAQDLSFAVPSNLRSDYVYQTTLIMVNKGDTLRIHFYNPTDTAHTFTVDAPYSNDITVTNSTTIVPNGNTTITANNAGIFGFHCRFHTPQMAGTIVVQG